MAVDVRSILIWGGVALAACGLSSCTWMDHRTNAGLKREITERSEQRLALIMLRGNAPLVQFFDGRDMTLHATCCPPVSYGTAWRDCIAMVDISAAPRLDLTHDPSHDPSSFGAALLAYGGPVVEIDTAGRVVVRSVVQFRPAPLSLASDGERFAIMSPPLGRRDLPEGLYVAGFHETTARCLATMKPANRYANAGEEPSSSWSPRGDQLLFSYLGTVLLIDVLTGNSKKLVDGGAAMWSPSGEWISYITPKSEVVLLSPLTRASRRIDPGREMLFAPKWSPDGKYLVVQEGDGGYALGPCVWIYRVSDGAWVPFPHLGAFHTEWFWIEMGPSKTQG